MYMNFFLYPPPFRDLVTLVTIISFYNTDYRVIDSIHNVHWWYELLKASMLFVYYNPNPNQTMQRETIWFIVNLFVSHFKGSTVFRDDNGHWARQKICMNLQITILTKQYFLYTYPSGGINKSFANNTCLCLFHQKEQH